MLKLLQFDYQLPQESIAQAPAQPRDSSKLLKLDRHSGQIDHFYFRELVDLLDKNWVLVRNNTKVMPARIFGKKQTGGLMELLLLKRVGIGESGEKWEVMTKPGLKLGQKVEFGGGILKAQCRQVGSYTRLVEFDLQGEKLFEVLNKIGSTPLPPYINWQVGDEQNLRILYQTIYAKYLGSAAAPTAGLHFTKDLEEKLRAKGVQIEEVTLHVGLGTFLPVKVNEIETHEMHSESYIVSEAVAKRLNKAKLSGKKIMAVGTTTTRVLESQVDKFGLLKAGQGETNIFIYPPYKFKFVDGLITNFHLPKSTLLMMIGAFVSSPNTKQQFRSFFKSSLGKAYQEAIKKDYRFYSFGDGMVVF